MNPIPSAKKPAPVEKKITPGVFQVPGGTLTLTDKGIMTYEGDPYLKVASKKKYRTGRPDRTPDGKVKASAK